MLTHIPELPADASNLAAALAYAHAGLYLLPVRRGTKNPGSIVGDDWGHKSSRDPETLRGWFEHTDHGIAIDMARSGLVGIDMDHPELAPLWFIQELSGAGAPYQSTRPDSDGRGHHIFRQPAGRRIGCSTGRALSDAGFEIRGDGGVLIAQPTHHPEGGTYHWERTGEIPVLPDEIAKVLPDTGDRESAATDAEVKAFLAEHTKATAPGRTKGWQAHWDTALQGHSSRHVTMAGITPWAMEEVRCEYVAGQQGADLLQNMFVAAKTREYNGNAPMSEASAIAAFNSLLAWGIAQAMKHPIEELRKRRCTGAQQNSTEGAGGPGGQKEPRKSLATRLVELGQDAYLLGVTPEGKVFGCAKDVPHIALPLKGGKLGLRANLAREFFLKNNAAPSQSSLTDCCTVLEGLARQQEPRELNIRVAGDSRLIHIDMADAGGNLIEIVDGNWQKVSGTPYMFGRTELTMPMADPVAPGTGSIEPLWRHINIAADDRPVLLAVMIDQLIQPQTSKPVTSLIAEHGSAKSTTMKRIVSLIDPSTVDARGAPRDEDRWLSQAAGSWVVALDNLSTVSDWLSDAICRASTGDGSVKRTLFTDDSLWVTKFRRCVMVTGIDLGGLNGDLTDRLVPIELLSITDADADKPDDKSDDKSEAKRRERETTLDKAWAVDRPVVLGGLLDLAAKVHAMVPTIGDEIPLPRMADFGLVLHCVDKITGTEGMARYRKRRGEMLADSAMSDSFIHRIVTDGCVIESQTASEILNLVTPSTGTMFWTKPVDWPKKARTVSTRLAKAAPALRSMGWTVGHDNGENKECVRKWTLIPPPRPFSELWK